MKTIIEMAREAGFVSAQFWPDDFKGLHASVERFATLVKAARDAELLEGVEMPEAVLWAAKESEWMWRNSDDHGHPYHIITKGQKVRSHQIPLVTADQLRETVAAAVLRERESISQIHDAQEEMQSEIDELKAGNERLRADAARYQFIRVGDPDNAVMTWVNGLDDWTPWASPEDVDAAIDAAMKGQP